MTTRLPPEARGGGALPFHVPAVSSQHQASAVRAFLQGKSFLKQREYEEAVQAFKRAIALRVLYPDACKGVAKSYYAMGDAKQTVIFMIKATAHNIRLNRLEPAVELFTTIRKIHANAPNLFLLAAQAAARVQHWHHAIVLFGHAAQFSPDNPEVQLGQIEALMALGREEHALNIAESMLFEGKAVERASVLYHKITGEPWSELTASMQRAHLADEPISEDDYVYGLGEVDIAVVEDDGDAETGLPTATPAAPDANRPLTLVVVDDEPHIRMLMEETLEDLEDDHVRILFAKDGQEGLEVIRREHPQLVFLDVMMPRMNGYQVCERVKSDPALQDVRVIMLSAKGQEVDKVKGEAVGADLYMTKPFSPLEVLSTARLYLGLDA